MLEEGEVGLVLETSLSQEPIVFKGADIYHGLGACFIPDLLDILSGQHLF